MSIYIYTHLRKYGVFSELKHVRKSLHGYVLGVKIWENIFVKES